VALGGALAVTPGPWLVYGIDAVGFATSFGLLTLLPGLPGAADAGPAALRGITGGLRYAVRRQDLLGSYLADLAAMIFAYPNALFPFLAAELHARWATGLMFAAPSVGAFGVTVLSGWMGRISRHGLAIARAAAAWGLAMAGFGLSPTSGSPWPSWSRRPRPTWSAASSGTCCGTRPSLTSCAGGWPEWSC
jgi:hypothetical protein